MQADPANAAPTVSFQDGFVKKAMDTQNLTGQILLAKTSNKRGRGQNENMVDKDAEPPNLFSSADPYHPTAGVFRMSPWQETRKKTPKKERIAEARALRDFWKKAGDKANAARYGTILRELQEIELE